MDDGTHTGLSSRFEDEVALELERLKQPPMGNPGVLGVSTLD